LRIRSIAAGKAPPTGRVLKVKTFTKRKFRLHTVGNDIVNVGEVVDRLGEGQVHECSGSFEA
jgi:hypothetical protein